MEVADLPLRGMEALQQFLADEGQLEPPSLARGPMVRLASAVAALRTGSSTAPSRLDLAVLVRHLLRWCAEAPEMGGIVADLLVPGSPGWPDRETWERVGVLAQERGALLRVTARPWLPDWLPDGPPDGVDGRAAGAPQRRLNSMVPADPFLRSDFADRTMYRSAGQRTAMRACLLTPPGATLLVGLPTGDGKSMIFQALAKRGFPSQAERGLVVVVTPTVALALDHEASASLLNLGQAPLAYQGGDTGGANQRIVERVEAGTQGILFTSPEAICRGPLGRALSKAAERGTLSALVVDEAHLIEAWGKEFRPDFQLLAGVRRHLLQSCGGTPFRTILLSATITEQTVETVRTLYGKGRNGEEAFQLFSAMYLRPEIEYWVKEPLAAADRDAYVCEALYYLPRPAILYVTTIEDAKRWAHNCNAMGFARIGMMTGETPSEERERIVRAWKVGELDLVVGNSAFGLGIDKPDVRAVIHACVPESLDRFYQEVGRGGRDGSASLSLLLPTHEDVQTARWMQPKLIGIEKGFKRWESMYLQHRIFEPESGTHLVWVDSPPGGGADRMDLGGKKNTHWNLNTLTLMASAGLLQMEALVSLPVEPQGRVIADPELESEQFRAYQRVFLPDGPFLDEAEWGERVQSFRQASSKAQMESVDAVLSLWQGDRCLAERFMPIYTLPGYGVRIARHCGGCPACRRQGGSRQGEAVPQSPWPWGVARLSGVGANLVDEQNRLFIYYDPSHLPTVERKWERVYGPIAALLRRSGIHNVIIPPSAPFRADLLQKHCGAWPLFVSDSLLLPMRPPGPAVVVLPAGTVVTPFIIRPRAPEDARIFLVDAAVADPTTLDSRLIERFACTLPLDLLKKKVEQ